MLSHTSIVSSDIETPITPMARSSPMNSAKPLLKYCLFMVPLILLITALTMGIFSDSNHETITNAVNSVNAHSVPDASRTVQLFPSSKYSAGILSGVSNSDNVKVVSTALYDGLISAAYAHPRKRKMVDLTKDPSTNSMQTLINTWTNGSYSPVHRHNQYSEVTPAITTMPMLYNIGMLQSSVAKISNCLLSVYLSHRRLLF